MVDKILKARKVWICANCGRLIEKGEKYRFVSAKEPVYAEDVMGNYVQDGVEYLKYHLCLRC